jgi:hypothetical protein
MCSCQRTSHSTADLDSDLVVAVVAAVLVEEPVVVVVLVAARRRTGTRSPRGHVERAIRVVRMPRYLPLQ